MTMRKMILHNLVKNSIAAYFAAIEIHNKPNIPYRYETVTLLMMNAWELILKAFVWKQIKNVSLFEKNGHSITLSKALGYVNDYINSKIPKSFNAIKENIVLIEQYRNDTAHLYNENLEPCIFALVACSALNYVDFVRIYFSKDIMSDEGLFIMPLGFKLPFRPAEFLSKNSPAFSSSVEGKEFINRIVTVVDSLRQQGIEDSVVIGFDVHLQNVNRIQNSELLVAITAKDEASATLEKVKTIKLSDDPGAQVYRLSDEEFRNIWKYTHSDLQAWCKENVPGFKSDSYFNQIKRELESDIKFVIVRKLDPKKVKTTTQKFYTALALQEMKNRYLEQRKHDQN